MFEQDICKEITLKVYNTLKDAEELKYAKISLGYYPKSENLISPELFPAIIVEYGLTSDLDFARTLVFSYTFTVPIVIVTLADTMSFSDLIYNVSGRNKNKGIGDIAYDVKKVLWTQRKGNFEVPNVVQWNMVTHYPSVPNIQRILSSIFVRGLQIDVVFTIYEQEV